jgi:hypothetical protein
VNIAAKVLILLVLLAPLVSRQVLQAQIDPRFGTVGREGAQRLNLARYREYQRQNLDPVLAGKQKHFVVGQITNRNDALGIDWEWYLLDLLEQPNSLLLQHFLNFVLAVAQSDAVPIVRDAWKENRDDLEALWAKTVDGTSKTWSKKVLGVTLYSYTVRLSNTKVQLPEELPDIQLTVAPDGESINFAVDLNVLWSTQARGSNGSIHASPTFDTKLSILGTIEIGKDEQGRYLAVKEVHGTSVTDARGDIKFTVNILNVGKVTFKWRKIDILVQSQIDRAAASGIGQIMQVDQNQDGKPDLAQRFRFESFLSKTFFDGKALPTHQEIIDRVFDAALGWKLTRRLGGRYLGNRQRPNWFPLMPISALYARYYKLIKGLDPTAKCMIGGLFLKEAIDNPKELIAPLIPDFFSIFREELATFVSQSLFSTSTVAWYEAFLAALPPDVRVDIGNFHLYPIRAKATAFQLADVQPHIEKLAASFTAHGTPEIWVTEFGNFDWRRNEQEAIDLCVQLLNYFVTNNLGIQQWFWSRSIGYDRRFDTINQKPISALLEADGKTLTVLGQIYQIAADLSKRRQADLAALSPSHLPHKLTLAPSYPNPYTLAKSGQARIAYALPKESEVRLRIYDVLGRLTREIVEGRQSAGVYEVFWDGRNALGGPVTSGIYFIVLNAGEQRQTQKMIVTR